MEFNKILKKIQKKQKLLLKVLVSEILEADQEGRLNKIAAGLRLMGLINEAELSLSAKGREFTTRFGGILFQDIFLDNRTILDKLLQRGMVRMSSEPKIPKAVKLFLVFLLDSPVNANHIRGAKNLIPVLQNERYISVSETISITDLGREMLGYDISSEMKEEARKRFFTTVRSDGKSKIMERAGRFLTLYRNGFTYQEIGDLHGLTRERVRQIK